MCFSSYAWFDRFSLQYSGIGFEIIFFCSLHLNPTKKYGPQSGGDESLWGSHTWCTFARGEGASDLHGWCCLFVFLLVFSFSSLGLWTHTLISLQHLSLNMTWFLPKSLFLFQKICLSVSNNLGKKKLSLFTNYLKYNSKLVFIFIVNSCQSSYCFSAFAETHIWKDPSMLQSSGSLLLDGFLLKYIWISHSHSPQVLFKSNLT